MNPESERTRPPLRKETEKEEEQYAGLWKWVDPVDGQEFVGWGKHYGEHSFNNKPMNAVPDEEGTRFPRK